jgi:type VI secretion system secreted protein VgrG
MISYDQFKNNILPITLRHEGGYANVKGDNGGETYRGISTKNNPNWKGWEILEKYKPLSRGDIINDNALKDLVAKCYYEKYFIGNHFEQIESELVALQLFDFAVHGGFSWRRIQRILNEKHNQTLVTDSIFGKKTLAAINQIAKKDISFSILENRKQRLENIIEENPSQAKFRKGWMRRIDTMKFIVLRS